MNHFVSILVMAAGLCITAGSPAGEAFYIEKDGLVVVEVESVPAARGWEEGTKLTGFTGRCYYTDQGGAAPLTYKILIVNPGRYTLSIRNRHDFHDSTLKNDCWTRMDDGRKIKIFSSKRGEWTWHSRHELSGNDKPQAGYDLTAGLHTFEISGRSSGFSIDRFHLYLSSVRNATDESHPESRALPSMPELKVLTEVAAELKQSNLGKAMVLAERAAKSKEPAEQEEAARVMKAIRSYADRQCEVLRTLKPTAPGDAATMLGKLAEEFKGSQLGHELGKEARAWAQEPATRKASQAQVFYEQIAKMAAPLMRNKERIRKKASRDEQQRLASIRQGTLLLKKRFPDTPAYAKAANLSKELGIQLAD